jgi:hypothetical protein
LNQLHFFPLPPTDIVKAGMECVNFGGGGHARSRHH